MLHIPPTWLKKWVTAKQVPHQRSGSVRGVWFTYSDVLRIGELMSDLMSGRQANSRAEQPRSADPAVPNDTVDNGSLDLDLERFAGLRSLR